MRAHLPAIWPGFQSRRRFNMWVCFFRFSSRGLIFGKSWLLTGPESCSVYIQDYFFNSVAVIMVKLSVNKSNGLIFLNMTRTFIVYILI